MQKFSFVAFCTVGIVHMFDDELLFLQLREMTDHFQI